MTQISRRTLLGALSAGVATYSLADLAGSAEAQAVDPDLPLFVFGYFQGGWDTLLSLDPRDATAFPRAGSVISPSLDLAAGGDFRLGQELANNPTGLLQPNGSNIVFGASMDRMANMYEDVAVVRGIDMGTLTHEVGMRYFLTGKFPRGLQASGSALPTWVVNPSVDQRDIPNLVVGMESYNDGLHPSATGMRIESAADLALVLLPLQPELAPDAAAREAINAYHAEQRCHDARLNGAGAVSAFNDSRPNAARLASGELFEHFNFFDNPPSAEIATLYQQFNITNPAQQLGRAAGQAALAAQALRYGISQAVSVEFATGIDHHDNAWQTQHSARLRDGFNAAADLIAYLKSTEDGDKGTPLWDRTVLVLWSEFSRTPAINARGGRDHHLANACLIGGKGIKGNQVLGATRDANYNVMPMELDTGSPSESGEIVRPTDIHATILEAMGLSYDNLANQDPKIIRGLLS